MSWLIDPVKTLAMPLGLGLLLYLFLTALQRVLRGWNPIKKVAVPLNLVFLIWATYLFLHLSDLKVHPRVLLSIQAAQLFLLLYILIRLLDYFLIDLFLGPQRRERIPHLLRDIIRWILVFIVLLWVLNSILGINLTPLVATSAVLTLVISFALQDTLANLFAGIALNTEKPFEIGDWIMVGERSGQVVDMTWRATRIKNIDDDYIVIPNGALAKESVTNLVAPLQSHARHLRIGVSYDTPPNKVKSVIRELLLETEGVLAEPPPFIRLEEYADFAMMYDIKFWVGPGSNIWKIKDEVLTRIWYQFRRHGIEIPFPVRTVHMRTISGDQEVAEREAAVAETIRILQKTDIFSPLSTKELGDVAPNLLLFSYAAGETLVEQGEPGDSFFAIREGTVEVKVTDSEGRATVLARLGKDAFFGEMSLLTGEKRNATVTALEDTKVLVLNKSVFSRVISANPTIAEGLSKVLERRQRERLEMMAKTRDVSQEKVEEIASENMLSKIRNFFGL